LDVHRRRAVEGYALQKDLAHVYRAGDEAVGGHRRQNDAKGRPGRRAVRAVEIVTLRNLKLAHDKAYLTARSRECVEFFDSEDPTGEKDDLTVKRDLGVDS